MRARAVATALIDLTKGDWGRGLAHAEQLRTTSRADALVLAATEAALESDARLARHSLGAFIAGLDDKGWISDIVQEALACRSIGIMSLGSGTLMALEEGRQAGAGWETLLTDRVYLARGVGYLGFDVSATPAEEAEALLAPGAATSGESMWTTASVADAMVRARIAGNTVFTVVHPLAELSPLNLEAFQPDAQLVRSAR